MNELAQFLMDHISLDFQGDLNLELVMDFLRQDSSAEAKELRAKLIADQGVAELLVVLADCLTEFIRDGVTEDKIREQLRCYVEA